MDASIKNSSPQMCGYYSITSDRKYDESASSLRYFKYPTNLPINLNNGINTIKDKPDSYFNEKMESILTYIMKHKDAFVCHPENGEASATIPSTKYITYRGVIRMIMCSPHEKRSGNGWCILATKYKNNIYLCQLTKPEKRDAFKNEPFSSKRFAYYGPKFEQCCLSEDPYSMPDTSQQIDACTQFFGVFKRTLVGRDFLFAGEMDGIISDTIVNLNNRKQLNNLKFIELKVCADPLTTRPENFRGSKCQNVWTQSFLTGVEDVYFGMRDHKGFVRKIEHYSTNRLLECGRNYWRPSECFKFLEKFLNMVETRTKTTNCPDTVFEFNFNQSTGQITCKEHAGKSDLSLLPDWYLNAFRS